MIRLACEVITLEKRIESAVAELNMQNAYKRVIIGFSGGADSSALLHYFKDRAQCVVCVHVNHMIRAEEADRDEAFCRSVCEKYNIELVCHKIDIPTLARERRQGLEQVARDERYRIFHEELLSRGFDAILTAHNANDNTESVIFNLVRGSGANGLTGIKGVNGKILRPLLFTTREQILEYCARHAIEYVTDSTNAQTEYTRNFIRHEVIPSLLKINPSLNTAITRLTSSLRTDEEFILLSAQAFIDNSCQNGKIPLEEFNACHDSVKARVLKLLAQENLDYNAISLCIDFLRNSKCGDLINLCKGVSLKREKAYAVFIKTDTLTSVSFNIRLTQGLNYLDGVGDVIAYMTDDVPADKELYVTLYLKNISGELIARSRIDGDTIRHGKMTKKVKKLMLEKQIPSHLRDRIPIICDDNGIVAIPSVAIRDGSIGTKNDIILRIYK